MRQLLLVLSVLVCSAAYSQESSGIRITHGPWLCDMDSTGVTVMWTTDKPALSWVEVAPDDGRHFYSEEHPRYYDAVHGRRRALETLHRVRIDGLKPGTGYMYRIFSRATEGWSYGDYAEFGKTISTPVYNHEPLRFRTFRRDDSPVRFFVMNDIHERSEDMRRMCSEVDFSQYDFVVLNGDMRSMTENESQIFDGWLDACVDMFASEVPIVFVRGNHETRGAYADRLFDYFPVRGGHFYHTFEAGGVGFVVLDGGEDKPDSDIEYCGIAEFDRYREQEAGWLEETIAAEGDRRRIVFLHIPPGTSTWHGDLHIRETLLPVLEKTSVGLMLSGHTHTYSLHKAGELAPFPILVNDNRSCVSVTVDGDTITAVISGNTGKSHTFRFPE